MKHIFYGLLQGSKRSTAGDFEDIFALDFTVDDGVELCEGGEERAVTLENRAEFVQLYANWLLHESVQLGLANLRKGYGRVTGGSMVLATLTADDLKAVVCGEPDLDLQHPFGVFLTWRAMWKRGTGVRTDLMKFGCPNLRRPVLGCIEAEY